MALRLTDAQVLRLRLKAQRLSLPPSQIEADPALVVKALAGIQAQEAPAAALAIRARSHGLVAADVERARVQARSILRTWGPRGTLHLLATEDLGWLLPRFGPFFVARGERRRLELGLDEQLCVSAMGTLTGTHLNTHIVWQVCTGIESWNAYGQKTPDNNAAVIVTESEIRDKNTTCLGDLALDRLKWDY